MSLNELVHPVTPITIITATSFEQYSPFTTATTSTITTDSLLGGLITNISTGAITVTLPTATLMLAALPEANRRLGSAFTVIYSNPTAYAVTLAAGTNFLIDGLASATIAANTSRYLVGYCTSILTPAFKLAG